MNRVTERPARILIAVESDDLKHQLQKSLGRFPSLWTLDQVQPIGPFDENSIVSALGTAVRLESDIVLYTSAIHNPESVASHFLDQRDLVFMYREEATQEWQVLTGPDSTGPEATSYAASLLLRLLA